MRRIRSSTTAGMRLLALPVLVGFLVMASVSTQAEELRWKANSNLGEFSHRKGFTLTEFNGKLWAVGGKGCTSFPDPCDMIAYSGDGENWIKVSGPLELTRRSGHAAVVFNGDFLIIGGQTSSGTLLDDVWRTRDGITWTKLVSDAGYLPRHGHSAIVHGNKIWLAGGERESGSSVNLMDIWTSYNGSTWAHESITDRPARRGHTMVSHRGELWVVGGEIRTGTSWVAATENWRRNPSSGFWSDISYGGLVHKPTQSVISFRGELWEFGVETFPSNLSEKETWRLYAYARNSDGLWRDNSSLNFQSGTGYNPGINPSFVISPFSGQLVRIHPFISEIFQSETYYSLTVKTKNGSVWYGSSGFSETNMTQSFRAGMVAQLSPFPSTGFTFDHWSGDAQGDAPVSLTLDRDKTVIATFGPFYPTITVTSTGSGRVSPAGMVSLTSRSSQNFQFRPNPGSRLIRLSVDGVEKPLASNYTFLDVRENHTLHVEFEGCTLTRIQPGFITVKTYADQGVAPVIRHIVPDGFGALAQSQLELGNQSFLVSSNIEDGSGFPTKEIKPYVLKVQDIPPDQRTAQPFQYEPMECEDVIRKANSYYDGSVPAKPSADGYAYSEIIYEPQPGVQVAAQGGPGIEYSADVAMGGHPQKMWRFGVMTPESFIANTGLTDAALNSKESEAGSEYRLAVIRDPNGNYSQVIEDLFGNVVSRWGAPNLSDATSRIVSKAEYDIFGRVTYDIPPLGSAYQSEFVQSVAGDMVSEKTPDAGVTVYRHDSLGRVRFVKTAKHVALDSRPGGKKHFIMFSYDALGRLSAVSEHSGTHSFELPDIPFVSGEGDSLVLKRFYFDDFTLTDLQGLGFSAPVAALQSVAEDVKVHPGQLAAAVSFGPGAHKTADIFSSDSRGFLKAQYRFMPGNVPIQKFEFAYDAEGKVVQEDYYNGFDESTGDWIPENNRETVYDALTRTQEIKVDGDRRFAYEYQENGPLAKEKLYVPGQAQVLEEVAYQYTLQDWVKRIATPGATPRFSAELDYGDLFNGNIQRTEFAYQINPTTRSLKDYQFQYDGVDRLTDTKTATDSVYATYRYDAQGRFTRKKEAESDLPAYAYPEGKNQVSRIPGHVAKGQPNAYVYDPDGNMVLDRSKKMTVDYDALGQAIAFRTYLNLPTTTLTWEDVENDRLRTHLGQVLLETVEMAYDAFGQRVWKYGDGPSGKSATAYVGNFAELSSPDADGPWTLETLNHWTAMGLRGRRDAGVEYTYLTDHMGSVRMGLNPAGEVVEALDYTPFGQPKRMFGAGIGLARHGYTEKEHDPETQLTYFGARYLDPELGAWTSIDPMGQYHNGYSFVGGDPINSIDLWGLEGTGAQDSDPGRILPDQLIKGKGPRSPEPGPLTQLTLCCQEIPSAANGRPVPTGFTTEKHEGTTEELGPASSEDVDKLVKASIQAMGSGSGGGGKAVGKAARYLARAGKSLGQKLVAAMGSAGAKGAANATGSVGTVAAAGKAATEAASAASNVAEAATAAKGGIRILQQEGNVIIAAFDGAAGEARVATELVREGETLILRGAHIEGQATLKEALEAAKQFGRENGAKRIIIEGGRRTTGANPGHIPRPIILETGL